VGKFALWVARPDVLSLPQMVNPNADAATQKGQALQINTGAAKGLAEVNRKPGRTPNPVSN